MEEGREEGGEKEALASVELPAASVPFWGSNGPGTFAAALSAQVPRPLLPLGASG